PPETLSSAAVPIPLPSEISKAPSNGGLEAVSVRPDGRILTIAEGFENSDGSFKAWLINNGHSAQLSYVPEEGFRASDAATLGNGNVLVLERRHHLPIRFSARLSLIKARDIKPGAMLRGDELARLESPLKTDNFEGIAVTQTREGTMIFLVSDDNYFFFQRTLLLQFLLPNSARAVD
ncbi:MAG: esterase-like activity of phytase family protein, partial [Candidatus Binatia bacterium]